MAGKYETHVKSRFDEIAKWCELGLSDKDIAKNLGIHKATMVEYKHDHPEFSEHLRKSRLKPVNEIKNALLKSALGFQYEEKKVITQQIKFDDGEKEVPAKLVRTEITTKTALPNTGAGLVLLQQWAKDEGWSRDPQNLKIKKEELALKKKALENESW